MKTWLAAGMLLLSGCAAYAVEFETSGGVGAVVPDNENVESAVAGKVDGQFNLGPIVSLGISATQTGNFTQEQKPSEVKDYESRPQAFAGKKFHHINGDTIIVENYDVDIDVQVMATPDPKPARPRDLTEKSFWAAEPYLQLNLPISRIVRPYARFSIGAAGMKSWNGETNVGVSKGIGGGLSVYVSKVIVSIEALRRHIDTNVQTYGNWSYMAKAGLQF